jgi:uncharacterized protein YndB with AHSA1/START domain
MAFLPVPPERVFAVLADPETYACWVVGSHSIRSADATWPAPGSKLHHRVGVGPFTLNDSTEVLEADPPRRLVLQARARPLGSARVAMEEGPGDLFSRLLHNPLADRLLGRRNDESLRRLGELAGAGEDAPRIEVRS